MPYRISLYMEALTAVQVALLTIYDMCKAVDRGMVMGDVKLLEKSGGQSKRNSQTTSIKLTDKFSCCLSKK